MSDSEDNPLRDLREDFKRQWASKEIEFERQIQSKLGEAKANQTTSLTQEQIGLIEQNIRKQWQSKIDHTKELLGKKMFEDYGGSEEEALKQQKAEQSKSQQKKLEKQRLKEQFRAAARDNRGR